ncbi:hypothetical protein RSO01_90480 [Reyranella soli]|uniref:Uncharacterized protein n=1 Tax=Reyranella soli TaxID=1230389 RepID=A0A512NSJ1_9HYPH|nr:hypothetical protein RSO01_90480 [Reyranella soli]
MLKTTSTPRISWPTWITSQSKVRCPKAKLLDTTGAKVTMSADELKSIGAWVRKHAMDGRGPIGPLAIVSNGGNQFDAAHFADTPGSNRPLRIFRDKARATAWLKQAAKAGGR